MIEAIAIIAIGAVILLYAQRQPDKKLLSSRITNFVAMKVEQMQKMKQKLKDFKTGIILTR